MLVCSISMRPRRGAIAADVAETAFAVDEIATGLLYTLLIDDPASALDSVDAFFGEIMIEAVNAADNFSVELVFTAAVDEPASASATASGAVPVITAGKTAMLAAPMPIFVNADTSREAALAGPIMVNL
jgi:hypothetical protein